MCQNKACSVSEEHFWRNYFYRVSLIVRQSTTAVSSDNASGNDEQRGIDDASSFEDDTLPTVTEAELDQVGVGNADAVPYLGTRTIGHYESGSRRRGRGQTDRQTRR
jgi:hypothetical protein